MNSFVSLWGCADVHRSLVQHWLIRCACLVLCLSAGVARATPLVSRSPIDVAGRPLRSMVLADFGVSQVRGKLTLAQQLRWVLADRGGSLRAAILAHLRQRGYPVLDGRTFGAGGSQGTELALGGTISDFECDPSNKRFERCAITVDWELTDLRRRAVAYRMRAVYGEDDARGVRHADLLRLLVLGALDSLLAREGFVAALGPPSESAPPALDDHFAELARCTMPPGSLPADIERAAKATVFISAGAGSGSGIFISDEGWVLTAAHVASAESLWVRTHDGRQVRADVVRKDARSDVALLRVNIAPEACLPITQSLPSVGANAFAVGAPLGADLSFSITRGVVSSVRRRDGVTLVQTDASLNPGNSGGPLLDEQGHVVAVVASKIVGHAVEGLGFGVYGPSALEALGLILGERTAPQLRAVPVAPSTAVATVAMYDQDPGIDVHAIGAPYARVRRKARILLWSGVGLVGAGLVTLLAASAGDSSDLDEEEEAWTGADTAAAVGLGLLGSGAVLAATAPIYRGVALKRLRERNRGVTLELSPRAARLTVRF